jgi:vacuolar-type H+-ATPase subunit I/STV1
MAIMAETPDLNSVLTHVSSLETEKKQLQSYLAQQNERIEKLTASKRDEMKKQLDTMISEWLNNIDVTDETMKQDFMTGMERIVKDTKDESSVWQVMCCASAAHKRNVGQLQKIQDDYNTLKTKVEGGTFQSEEARVGSKRKEPEEPSRPPGNIWDEFETFTRAGGINNFTPDPGTIKTLRQEWVPI